MVGELAGGGSVTVAVTVGDSFSRFLVSVLLFTVSRLREFSV